MLCSCLEKSYNTLPLSRKITIHVECIYEQQSTLTFQIGYSTNLECEMQTAIVECFHKYVE